MGRFSGVLQGAGAVAMARKALRRPGLALAALSRMARSNWETLAFPSSGAWSAARKELADSGLLARLQAEIADAFAGIAGETVRGRPVTPGGVSALHAEMLWAIVRSRRPTIVVETGVCNGLSSAVILEAMDRNGSGHLISVDLPEFSGRVAPDAGMWDGKGGAVIPAGREVGWLVRPALRSRWTLTLGRSQDVLGPLLARAPIDVFIHDSEHSYANQAYEFEVGYRALRPGGLLVATDINWSAAFDDFARPLRATPARAAYVDHSCALVAKP